MSSAKLAILGLAMCVFALMVIGYLLQSTTPLWLALPIIFAMLVVGAFGTIFFWLGIFE